MWFMNKVANPFVGLVLRSPLHGLMSAGLLLLSYRGRRSGREYTLPVQYVHQGDDVYAIPGMPESKTWWRNLRGSAPVELTLRGKTVSGRAIVLQREADHPRIVEALRLYLERFPAASKLHAVGRQADGSFDPEELDRAAWTTIVVQVALLDPISP